MRNASKPVKKRATRRPKRWMSPTASSQSAAVTFSPACHSARFSGSISSAPGSRPRCRIQYCMIHAAAALIIVPMAAPTSGVKPGQSVSVTSWPSEAHSRAACSAAATQSGWPRSPSGVRVVKPIRSRPGSAPTSAPNGRAGGGAQYGSPRSGPDVASSSAALSRTERVSACSTAPPAATSPYSGPSGLRARVGLRANRPHADAG